MKFEDLYDRIDKEEDMTDQEKREAYFREVDEEQARESEEPQW